MSGTWSRGSNEVAPAAPVAVRFIVKAGHGGGFVIEDCALNQLVRFFPKSMQPTADPMQRIYRIGSEAAAHLMAARCCDFLPDVAPARLAAL